MTDKRWSLAKRLTWWVSLVTVLPQLAAISIGGFFLESSVSREIRAFANEETEEAILGLRQAGDPVVLFRTLSAELAAQHPGTRLAWRLLDARTGATLGEYGARSILDDLALARPSSLDRTVDLGRGVFARTVTAPRGMHLLLVVDAKRYLSFLGSYWLAAGVMLALSSAVALGGSRLLANRVAGLVRNIADDVRAARDTRHPVLHRSGPPEEIREVVEALRQEMAQIREDSERMRLFTAGLAHELRSPLQNLIGQAEVTLFRQRDPPRYEAVLSSQLEELTELSDAVDNLLTICTANTAARGGAVEEFDLAGEAELRLQRERGRADREGVELRIRTSGVTRIAGDREGLLRAIRNILANAIDWTPRGGRVMLSIAGDAAGIAVTVDDSGPGVPVEQRDRIFEPFVQGPAAVRKRSGYGLGLAIAKAAVHDHGGRILAETSPLGGARFSIVLPPARSPATPAPRATA